MTGAPDIPTQEAQIKRLREACAGSRERADIGGLLPAGAIGIELGVAFAGFSNRLLARSPTLFLYGVDMYAGDRNHDTEQYAYALRTLLPYAGRSHLIRARFDEAVHVFPDAFFDFIYVDGYAHTGEEDGATFREWLPKLKPGGVMAGDDYHAHWPKVVEEVDRFVAANGFVMFSLSNDANLGPEFPQWFVVNARKGTPELTTALGAILTRVETNLAAGLSAG